MADLYDRLFPSEPGLENIHVHQFHAAIVDYVAGYTSRAQIVAHWELDEDAQADLDVLCDYADTLPTLPAKVAFAVELHAVLLIAEEGVKYRDKASFAARLGL